MYNEQYSKSENNVDMSSINPSKPAFGYYGAKQRISSFIINLLPPHNAWVEVFCGSSAITLAKKPAPIEIINDLDGNIVNVFKQLRENGKELINLVELTPYAREEFENAKLIFVIGSNWKKVPGAQYIREIKGEIIQPPFYERLSTENIVNKIFRIYKRKVNEEKLKVI